MACRLHKRMALRRKLHILRNLTKSKSVKRSSIVKDASLYICKLKFQLEAIRKEYQYLTNHFQDVKVEKFGEGYLVRVACKMGKDLLVSILEAFDEIGINVLQARVTCNFFFVLEAIVEAQNNQAVDGKDITQAIIKAIDI